MLARGFALADYTINIGDVFHSIAFFTINGLTNLSDPIAAKKQTEWKTRLSPLGFSIVIRSKLIIALWQ